MNSVTFLLMVDEFGVKYVGKDHVTHLVYALQQYYKIPLTGKVIYIVGLTWTVVTTNKPWKSTFQGTYKIICSSYNTPSSKIQKMNC